MQLQQAVYEGTVLRLRPVLMTATISILGLLPLLSSRGAGSEVQRPLAAVVIRGFLTSTALTLLLLPTRIPGSKDTIRAWPRLNERTNEAQVIPAKLLLLVRFVQGVGAAALSTVSITLVAKYFTAGRGRAFGIYNAIKGAGYVIAPALGGFLVRTSGFAIIFIVSAGVGAVALFLSAFLPSDKDNDRKLEDDDDAGLKRFLLIYKDRRLARYTE